LEFLYAGGDWLPETSGSQCPLHIEIPTLFLSLFLFTATKECRWLYTEGVSMEAREEKRGKNLKTVAKSQCLILEK